ncbi:fimbrial protein [Enterobacteriaceae bacterium 4M9]|nr:fimbrial protein [Enterobacteriaceae bacterium 4M9]
MMKKIIFISLISILTWCKDVLAWEAKPSCDLTIPPVSVNIKSGNVFSPGIDITEWRITECGQTHWLGTWQYGWHDSSLLVSTGNTYNDGSGNYTIFSTGTPGIGIVLGMQMVPNSISGASSLGFVPVASAQTVLTTTSGLGISNVQTTIKYKLVTSGQAISAGNYSFTVPLGDAQMKDLASNSYPVPVRMNVSSLVLNNKGCTVLTPNIVANMGIVGSRQLPAVGSVFNGPPIDVSLQCDTGVAVDAIFSDLTRLANTSQVLDLTPTSTAAGVGVRLLFNNTPLQFAYPAIYPGAPGLYAIKTASDSDGFTFSLTPQYIRTGALATGTANATAVVTFIYQ